MIALTEGITPEHLAFLYSDPLIARTGDDGSPAYPCFHELATYLTAWVDGEFAGAYLVIRFTDFEYESHSFLLARATRRSRSLGALLLAWVFSHPCVLRLTGYVREGLESARNHCLRMGFQQEGFRRDALLVRGEPKGIYIMGITRNDWSKTQ